MCCACCVWGKAAAFEHTASSPQKHATPQTKTQKNKQKITGGRNGYGAKLANIFSTRFVVATADGRRGRRYEQVFTNNMSARGAPAITACKASDNWTCITFSPDRSKFDMTELEDDVVALMTKRVYDVAGVLGKGCKVRKGWCLCVFAVCVCVCLGSGARSHPPPTTKHQQPTKQNKTKQKTTKVYLNGARLPVKGFSDYVDLYLGAKDAPGATPRVTERVTDRWEVRCVVFWCCA